MRVDKIMGLANSVLGGQRGEAIKLIAQGAQLWSGKGNPVPQQAAAAQPDPAAAASPSTPAPAGYGAPPPPAAQAAPQQEEGLEADEWALLRVMAAAAQSDGHVAPHEQNTILGQAQKLGASVEQMQQLSFELRQRVAIKEIVQSVDSVAMRKFMYQFAFAIVKSDHNVTQHEIQFLTELASATELSHEVLGSLVQ